MSSGKGAFLPPEDALAKEEFLAIAETSGEAKSAKIFLAAPITRGEIEELYLDRIVTRDIVAWDALKKTVICSRQRRLGSLERCWKRRSCSSSLTENQYLRRMVPERTIIRSYWGQERRNSRYCCSLQKPITCSVMARVYQLRSKRAISPPAGRWATQRWKYHEFFPCPWGCPGPRRAPHED